MHRTKVMVNGLPGNMAALISLAILKSDEFELVASSLTGPEIEVEEVCVGSTAVRLIKPCDRDVMDDLIGMKGRFISVDFTEPSAALENASYYCHYNLPFVMGTTGGDEQGIRQIVERDGNVAVLSSNMAIPIVVLQAAMKYAAERFPNALTGFDLTVSESHQAGKKDTSGTAKTIVSSFNGLGIDFSLDQIQKIRDPLNQRDMGVPDEYLGGHGWHDYRAVSNDRTVELGIVHNINGREVYVDGTLKAIKFLEGVVQKGVHGKLYSMIDVISG